MAAVLGGTQSLHTNSLDETYALPTEEAVTIALRTQQIIACESGADRVADPLAGSYYVEYLTNEMEKRALDYIHRIDQMGGMLRAQQVEGSKSQAILESIADGVIVFDNLGKASVVNPAISRLMNLPLSQVVGYRIETLMVGLVSVGDQQAVLEQLRAQESSARQPGLRLQWGTKTLSASFAPIHIQQEAGQGTVAVFEEFTKVEHPSAYRIEPVQALVKADGREVTVPVKELVSERGKRMGMPIHL